MTPRLVKLTKDQLKAIDDALRTLYDLRANLDAACRVGIDCTERYADLDTTQQMLEALKREFGPGVR